MLPDLQRTAMGQDSIKRKVALNAVLVTASTMLRALESTVRSVVYMHVLGVGTYGSLAIFVAQVAMASELLNVHAGSLVLRFSSDFKAKNDQRGLGATALLGGVVTLVSCAASVAVALTVDQLFPAIEKSSLWVRCLFVLSVASQQFDVTGKALLRHYGRFALATSVDLLSTLASVIVLLVVYCLPSMHGVDQCLAAWSMSALFLPTLTVLSAVAIVRKETPCFWRIGLSPVRGRGREVARILFSGTAITTIQRMVGKIDLVILGWTSSSGSVVSSYDIAKKIYSLIGTARGVLSIAVFPEMLDAIKRRNDGLRHKLSSATAGIAAVGLVVPVGVMFLWSPVVSYVYGDGLVDLSLAASILAYSSVLNIAFFWQSSFLYACSADRYYFFVAAISAIFAVAVCLSGFGWCGTLAAALSQLFFIGISGLFSLLAVHNRSIADYRG